MVSRQQSNAFFSTRAYLLLYFSNESGVVLAPSAKNLFPGYIRTKFEFRCKADPTPEFFTPRESIKDITKSFLGQASLAWVTFFAISQKTNKAKNFFCHPSTSFEDKFFSKEPSPNLQHVKILVSLLGRFQLLRVRNWPKNLPTI